MALDDFDYEAQKTQFENAGLTHKDAHIAASVVGENISRMFNAPKPDDLDAQATTEDRARASTYPQSLTIKGMEWRVHWFNDAEWMRQRLPEGDKGRCDPDTHSIFVRTSIKHDVGGTPTETYYGTQALGEVLVHEALHAMICYTTLDRHPRSPQGKWDQEEYFVFGLAPQLQAFIKENPDALEWLQAARHG